MFSYSPVAQSKEPSKYALRFLKKGGDILEKINVCVVHYLNIKLGLYSINEKS